VWVKWIELRVHGEVGAIEAPTGLVPKYQDLKPLFREVLEKDYSHEDYVKQFTIRVPENISKVDRAIEFHKKNTENAPAVLFEVLERQRERLLAAQKEFGDYISPERFPTV